jgi:hypothetical protein
MVEVIKTNENSNFLGQIENLYEKLKLPPTSRQPNNAGQKRNLLRVTRHALIPHCGCRWGVSGNIDL